MVQFNSFACGYPVFPAPFVKKTILSSVNGLDILVENHSTIYTRVYFWALYCFIGQCVSLYASTTLF